jgi:uncharacterized protein YbjT (DUF2867 family)
MSDVFISGGTGYIGRRLTAELIRRKHQVVVLARPGSESRAATGAATVTGNALDASTITPAARSTYVHLTGVSHPAPWKEKQFREIDLVSLRASAEAAANARVAHFVYVSVAHPAPTMKAYIRVRMECEEILRSSGLLTTILRPWYVLGPGHRWPILLKPFYAMADAMGNEGARRLGLVTLDQMVAALAWAVENPPASPRVLDVPAIRRIGP